MELWRWSPDGVVFLMRISAICQLNVSGNLIEANPTELIWTIDFYRLLLIPEMTFHDYMPVRQNQLSCLAGEFYALNSRILYKIYSEPFRHVL